MTAGSCLQLRQRRSFRSRPLTPGVFFAEQPLIEPVAHEQHDYCKRQCAADGGGLQCAEPTGNEQYEAITPLTRPRRFFAIWRSSLPPEVMISITRDPESDEVTKKVTISTIASSDASDVRGRCSRKTNRAVGSSVVTAEVISPPRSLSSISSAELPKILNQKNVNPAGISNTPSTNSRIVRPREILATNMPTNGTRKSTNPSRTGSSRQASLLARRHRH